MATKKAKKTVNLLTSAEHRVLLLNLASEAPGRFFQTTDRAIKSEGQGKILKVLQPKRKQSGKFGKLYSLMVYVCYHVNLGTEGAKWRDGVVNKLKSLGESEVLTEEKGQNGHFLTFGVGLELSKVA